VLHTTKLVVGGSRFVQRTGVLLTLGRHRFNLPTVEHAWAAPAQPGRKQRARDKGKLHISWVFTYDIGLIFVSHARGFAEQYRKLHVEECN
jgi:hypothetical protein